MAQAVGLLGVVSSWAIDPVLRPGEPARPSCSIHCPGPAAVRRARQVGVFEKAPERVARTIQAWLGPDARDEFAAMKVRAKALGKPHALFDICRDLNGLVPAALQGAQGAAGVPALTAA